MGIGDWGLGIGDWGLGIGDWGLGPIPNPHIILINFYLKNYTTFKIIKYTQKKKLINIFILSFIMKKYYILF